MIQTAITTALIIYGLAIVISLAVSLMIKGIYWAMQTVTSRKRKNP